MCNFHFASSMGLKTSFLRVKVLKKQMFDGVLVIFNPTKYKSRNYLSITSLAMTGIQPDAFFSSKNKVPSKDLCFHNVFHNFSQRIPPSMAPCRVN